MKATSETLPRATEIEAMEREREKEFKAGHVNKAWDIQIQINELSQADFK